MNNRNNEIIINKMESGDIKYLIYDIFNKEYPYALLKCKNENEFENELMINIPKKFLDIDFLELPITQKLSWLISEFLKERNNENKIKDFENQIKINDIINNNLVKAFEYKYEEFNKYFHNIKELIPLIEKYHEYYKSCINATYYAKKTIHKFFDDNNDEKELKLIELNELENYFNGKQDFELKTILLKKEYKVLYDKKILEKKNLVKKHFEKKNKLNTFLDDNESKNSKNEGIFKKKDGIKTNSKNFYFSKIERNNPSIRKEYLEKKSKNFSTKENNIIKEYLTEIEQKKYEDINSIKQFEKIIENSKDIFFKENYKELIKENINLYLENLINDMKIKLNNINILLYGSSGQGKSTLINKIFDLKEGEKLQTGYEGPTTKETRIISSEKFPILQFIDTKGLDITHKKSNYLHILHEIRQLKKENADFYINCIWYCLSPLNTGSFDAELQLLKSLGNDCKTEELPIIIVGTKAVEPFFNGKLKALLEKNKISYPFCPILAEYMCKTEPYGIKSLIMISIEKVESLYYQRILDNIIQKINSEIDECNKLINDDIKKEKEKILDEIKDNYKISGLENDMIYIFHFIFELYFSKYLSNNNFRIINENDYYINKNDIKKMIEECLSYYKNNFKKFIDLHIEKLTKKLLDNNSYKNIVDSNIKQQTENELKNIFKNKFQEKSRIYFYKNIINIYIDILIKIFYEIFISQKEKIKQNKDNIISKISNQFKELKKSLEQYKINENSSMTLYSDKYKEMKINNIAKKNEYIHKESLQKLFNEKEKNEMESKYKLIVEENNKKIKMKKLENEKAEKELDYQLKKGELELKNEENKRMINLKEKDLELEEKKQSNQYDIERLSIEKNFQLKELEMKNKHEIDKMKLISEKEIEIKKLNIRNKEIELERDLIKKLNIIPTYDQIQPPMAFFPNPQNYYNSNIPMNSQFNYNYNFQQQMTVIPPKINQNFSENENLCLNNNLNFTKNDDSKNTSK